MKNINNIIVRGFVCCGLVAVLSTAFTSCRFEDDDYFSESASLRIEHEATNVNNLLKGAPNGWVMQYFCAADEAQFEGFNLFARFDDNGKATLASDHRLLRNGKAGIYTEASSPYEMLKEDALVLAFNVWNDVLTPFSDPVKYWAAPTYIEKDGVGMYGDHNFVIMSHNDNEIIMRGERHQAQVRLVKCDRDWQQYIADTETLKNTIGGADIRSYYVTNGEQTLYLDNDGTGTPYLSDAKKKVYGKFRYCDNLDYKKAVKADSIACVFTPNGLRFERQETIGDSKFQEFTLNEDKTALVSEDGTVQIIATWDRHIAERETIWFMDMENLSDELKQLAADIDAALKEANRNQSLYRIGIGKSNNGNYVLGLVVEWYTNTRKTSSKRGGVALKRSVPAFGQVKIEYDPNANIDNELRAKAEKVINASRAFAEKLAGTYDVTPENYFTPSPALFKDVNGVNQFKLATKLGN
jgi:hypothetical protein